MVDKSLPALPPNAIPPNAFSDDRVSPDSDTPTELSPRPTRPTYPRKESSTRGSPRPARSPERHLDPTGQTGLGVPPPPNYRNNRNSAIYGVHQADPGGAGSGLPPGAAAVAGAGADGGDNNSFFIPVALDPSPAPSIASPRSNNEPTFDQRKTVTEKDYFARPGAAPDKKSSDSRSSQVSPPHIAFQEKPRRTSSEYEASTPREPARKLSKSSRSDKSVVSQSSPRASDDKAASARALAPNGRPDEFKLQDAPKSKKLTKQSPPRTASFMENGSSDTALRKDMGGPKAESPPRSGLLPDTNKSGDTRENVARDEDKRPSQEAAATGSRGMGESGTSRPIPRKEVPASTVPRSGMCTNASVVACANVESLLSLVNGKATRSDELVPPPRPQVEQKLSDTYMSPRAPPPPPGATTAGIVTVTKDANNANNNNGTGSPKTSPKLPRWSSGGDFSMDEDMARILGTDEGSSSILRRVSNAVRHGRTASTESGAPQARTTHSRSMSETTRTTTSPRWPKTPMVTESNDEAKEISSPISTNSATLDDPAFLKRQLRNSEQRVAELERQFSSEKDLLSLNEKLVEKRKTVSVLDTQTEIMIRQLEVLAGYVERSKDTKRPIDPRILEDSAIKEFVQKLDKVKQSMTATIEQLHAEREELIDERDQAIADRDRALLEFEQLSSKNAQLADMNNDLTHQIQGRFRSQVGSDGKPNGLGIYANHKALSSTSVHNIDTSSIQTGPTMVGTDIDEPVLEGPTVVQVRKGQAKKFNWKKGGKTVAQNITKVGRAVAAFQTNERDPRALPLHQPGLNSDNIGLPYNMTSAQLDAPTTTLANGGMQNRNPSNDARSFGFFGKKAPTNLPKSMSSANIAIPTAVVDASTTLFGSELIDRTDFERRQIPSVVTRCIEEVELRGMDAEGIYRKSGGSGQVKMIQEGFDKMEEFDISDPSIDIASVTSVLKQYFRKLPTPLLTFDVYDRVLESNSTFLLPLAPLCRCYGLILLADIPDIEERCLHLRKTVDLLPQQHRDCLEFLMFHLARVASRERENLVSGLVWGQSITYRQWLIRSTDVTQEFGRGIRTHHHARPQYRAGDVRHARKEPGCAIYGGTQQRYLCYGLTTPPYSMRSFGR